MSEYEIYPRQTQKELWDIMKSVTPQGMPIPMIMFLQLHGIEATINCVKDCLKDRRPPVAPRFYECLYNAMLYYLSTLKSN